ncbi:MAG TPA: tetratricopeptide repeat protein [Chthonomonadaceae bacterium]|nr:tetratricopeptide repeat protein [Chthonomonadaceae bacterium]
MPTSRKMKSQKTRKTPAEPEPAPQRRTRVTSWRLPILLIAGLLLIGVALYVRSSPWMHETFLRSQDLPALEEIVRRHPDDALAQYYLGKRYIQAHRYADSRRVLETAVRLDPDSAQAHLDLGVSYFQLRDMERAQTEFAQALRRDDHLAQAEFMLGRIAWLRQDSTEALRHLKRATQLDERYDVAWYGMGVCLIQLGRRPEALAAMQKAAALNPKRPEYPTAIGELEVDQHSDIAEARRQYERALQLDPNFGPACALMGSLYLHYPSGSDSLDRAQELLERATHLPIYRPQDLYRDLGEVYTQKGQYKKAVAALQESIRRDPRDERSYYALVRAYRKMGDARSAAATEARFEYVSAKKIRKDSLEVHLQYHPNDDAARLSLARVCRDLGLTQAAINAYREYRRRRPGAIDSDLERLMQAYTGAAPGAYPQDFGFPSLP